MTEHNHEHDKELPPQSPEMRIGDGLDSAGKSLSEALRISFIILKGIMFLLVLIFLASGFKTVDSNEQALVLRFGKIKGVGESRILEPGWHLILPYPIDEIVKIPTQNQIDLPINSFWYYQRPSELLPDSPKQRNRVDPTLKPVTDGYCLVHSDKQKQIVGGSAGSDYHIVHCKWQLSYQIDEPERFFRNVYTERTKPGQSYSVVMEKSVTELLQRLFESSVVTAMVNYTVEEAISSSSRIPDHVERLLQKKLDGIESGIKIKSVQLLGPTWPRQVDAAFQDNFAARQRSKTIKQEAETYARNTLIETAGLTEADSPIITRLLGTLEDDTLGEEEKEKLWSQLTGDVQNKISEARIYRTEVVEAAQANAKYLQRILPEYRKRPELVIHKIYQDAVEYVLENADEKIIIQPTKGSGGAEIWIDVNRDPSISTKSKEQGRK